MCAVAVECVVCVVRWVDVVRKDVLTEDIAEELGSSRGAVWPPRASTTDCSSRTFDSSVFMLRSCLRCFLRAAMEAGEDDGGEVEVAEGRLRGEDAEVVRSCECFMT